MDKKEVLSLRRVAGESLIKYSPLFSVDGEVLFIIQESTVHVYSTVTSELVRELEKSNGDIVQIQINPLEPWLLLGCTVHGDIISWKYSSGTINSVVKLVFPVLPVQVATFNIVPYPDKKVGLVTGSADKKSLMIGMFDLTNGSQLPVKLPEKTDFSNNLHKVAVSKNQFIIGIIQDFKLFVANYMTGQKQCWPSADKEKFTVVACHPEEEVVATGDNSGKIFIYYKIFSKKQPRTLLVHWHHNPVGSIAFSESGSMMYSGGAERVLVAWNYHDISGKKPDFYPRINGVITQITVSSNSQKIAVATDDNAIMLVNPHFNVLSYIHKFTWAADDRTPWPKFPFGLKVDPRTSSIALNGRVGELQFYSTHTGSHWDFDITGENRLSLEADNILYNTRITQAALNMDWLVTAESLDDLENSPEVRMKFFNFDTYKQRYVLNTQIESPHEDGVTALAFSSSFSVDNLLCASSGSDRMVKVWSLQESTSIDKKGKYWVCLNTTSYKNLSVESLAFSPDGSLLAVGFGNTLCVYIPETLREKCYLSAPAGRDGSVNKLIVNIPKSPANEKHRTEVVERRKHIQQLVKAYLNNTNDNLLSEIKLAGKKDSTDALSPSDLSIEDKKSIYNAILSRNEMNLYQKLEIFQKLNIHTQFPADMRKKYNDYIQANRSLKSTENELLERSKNLPTNIRFIAQSKLVNYQQQRDNNVADDSYLKNVTFDGEISKGSKQKRQSHKENGEPMDTDSRDAIYPIKKVSQINHVVFGTREFSHFVIVCTEKRLLIWNTLTTHLHTTFKLSVQHITVDPYTSVVAVFTHFNELYVFMPGSEYLIHSQKNLPNINGAVWIPRRYPKPQSLDNNWQAVSQLFFLSENQELLYLASENDENLSLSKSTVFSEAFQLHPQTPFAAMIAKQITSDVVSLPGQRTYAGALLGEPTKRSVQSLTSLTTHTMASVRLLCYDFLASLASTENTKSKELRKKYSLQEEEPMDLDMDSDDDDDEMKEKIKSRKLLQTATTNSSKKLPELIGQQLDKLRTEELNFHLDLLE